MDWTTGSPAVKWVLLSVFLAIAASAMIYCVGRAVLYRAQILRRRRESKIAAQPQELDVKPYLIEVRRPPTARCPRPCSEADVFARAPQFVRAGDEVLCETDCAICLQELQEGAELAMPRRCGHVFHAACLDEWCKTKGSRAATCPLCKAVLINDVEAATCPPVPSPTESDAASSSRTVSTATDGGSEASPNPARPSSARRIAATAARWSLAALTSVAM